MPGWVRKGGGGGQRDVQLCLQDGYSPATRSGGGVMPGLASR